MDAKITLSFDEAVIKKAKRFAANKNISLSRLTEFLLSKVSNTDYQSLEDLPISDWVHIIADGEVQYQTRPKSNAALKAEYFKSKK